MTTAQAPSPIRAPELSGAIAWLNVPAPLSLKALRGKVVLLDFWTYGCINCIHILPDLKKLEAQFPNELVVIGVHAAKFDNEKATENIRQIIRRYEIAHPGRQRRRVPDLARLHRARLADARPHRPGRLHRRRRVRRGPLRGLEQAIAAVIGSSTSAASSTGSRSATLEVEGVADTALKFPGKVLATDGSPVHRRHESSPDRRRGARWREIDRIGSGRPGEADGGFAEPSSTRRRAWR